MKLLVFLMGWTLLWTPLAVMGIQEGPDVVDPLGDRIIIDDPDPYTLPGQDLPPLGVVLDEGSPFG